MNKEKLFPALVCTLLHCQKTDISNYLITESKVVTAKSQTEPLPRRTWGFAVLMFFQWGDVVNKILNLWCYGDLKPYGL